MDYELSDDDEFFSSEYEQLRCERRSRSRTIRSDGPNSRRRGAAACQQVRQVDELPLQLTQANEPDWMQNLLEQHRALLQRVQPEPKRRRLSRIIYALAMLLLFCCFFIVAVSMLFI
ncbi:maker84 [Drosophila busckii]|uniref:Maker84 n=1 Tax=Drosophila busckii TaxID=30019 RepID=A0A0M4EKG3_DROBS|nr:maker84 [Drosophila busckii]